MFDINTGRPDDAIVSRAVWQFDPITHTGTAGLSFYSTQKDLVVPAITIGNKTNANCVLKLTAGQSADYCCTFTSGMAILFSGRGVGDYEVTKQNGAITVSTGTTTAPFLLVLKEIVTPQLVLGEKYRIECTSGEIEIIGVMFYSGAVKQFAFNELNYIGTWDQVAGSYSAPTRYTDTLNDYLEIPFDGNGIQVLLGNRPQSGIIDVYLDGVLVDADKDLYNTGGLIASLEYFADTDKKAKRGKHLLKIVYKGDNASVQATTATYHRLQYYASYAVTVE